MPLFEFNVLLKALPRTEITAALKRVGTRLLDEGVIIHKIENLGLKDLPYRMIQDGQPFFKGHQFIFYFMGSMNSFKNVDDICKRDLDLLRFGFANAYKDLNQDCSLQEELLPPAYRESVQKMMNQGRRYKQLTKRHYKHERDYSFFDVYM
ncbi:small ribosomal subunit protein bS6m [Parasteatoda tepidariorum]|uniref:small ribosomal subunit protein bS6m n=1 Tax=Parasteatoda tepidariorum TaxID=114398 RepID=UPI00077FDFFF|nr:probable 28S ribosomal protein S6, mitochondrial [Parasteatoda tepidariorum]